MDLREIGNLFMVGFRGTEFSAELRELLDDLNPCGVILFSRNIESPFQIARLHHELQRFAHERLSNGLFIGVDQEGGRVRRLGAPFSTFPPALSLATSDKPEEAVRDFSRVTARELRLVGFNVDFVPVLDVLGRVEDLESSVIGDRSFGTAPDAVAHLGSIVIEGMRSSGVIPCCKHFPGHGGTAVDSHLELPEDDRPAELIARHDLIPFATAVAQQVEMVMTAHVRFPALDKTLPATLSQQVVGGLLREELAYDGVVITDDLDMGAVANGFSPEECTLGALSAGVDILLICHSVDKAFRSRSFVLQALKDGEISETRIRESLRRTSRLKSWYGPSMQPCDVSEVREYF